MGTLLPPVSSQIQFQAQGRMLRFVVATCLLALAAGQVVPIKTEEFQCAGRDGLFPNENDCSTFFNCGHDGTQAWKQECQAGLVFNPEIGACDWPSNYACKAKSKTTPAPKPTTPAPEPTTPAPEAEFESEGCYRNKIPQQLTLLEKTDDRLDKVNYKKREHAIEKCYAVAKDAGYEHFAIGNKGQCWGSNGNDHEHYGKAKQCPKHGKGKYAVINVYSIAANKKQ